MTAPAGVVRTERLLSVAQAAAILGRDPTWVRRLIRRGELPAERLGPFWLLPETPVRAYRPRSSGRPRRAGR